MGHAAGDPLARAAHETAVRLAEARLARCLLALQECLEFGRNTTYVRALIRAAERDLASLRAARRRPPRPPRVADARRGREPALLAGG